MIHYYCLWIKCCLNSTQGKRFIYYSYVFPIFLFLQEILWELTCVAFVRRQEQYYLFICLYISTVMSLLSQPGDLPCIQGLILQHFGQQAFGHRQTENTKTINFCFLHLGVLGVNCLYWSFMSICFLFFFYLPITKHFSFI